MYFHIIYLLEKTLNHLEVKPGLVLLPWHIEVCLFLRQHSQKSSELSIQIYQKAGFTCASMKPAAALSRRAIKGARTATPQGRGHPLGTTATTATSNTHSCPQQHRLPALPRGKCFSTQLPKMLFQAFSGGRERRGKVSDQVERIHRPSLAQRLQS